MKNTRPSFRTISVEHPAIREMIGRRSGGDPDYEKGLVAHLSDPDKPCPGNVPVAWSKGWTDGHDMRSHLLDSWGDALAETDAAPLPEVRATPTSKTKRP